MKVSIEQIEETLRSQKLDPQVIVKIVNELEAVAQEEKEDNKKDPKDKKKNKFVVVALDPTGALKASGGLTGWVLTMEDSAPDQEVFTRINAAANAYNQSKKGRKTPARNVGDAIEVPRKFWKTDKPSEKTLVKTRSPIYILSTDGNLG